MSAALQEIEERLPGLSYQERLILMERLSQSLREGCRASWESWDTELAGMAADPEIQREVREIDAEFAGALRDGLEGL